MMMVQNDDGDGRIQKTNETTKHIITNKKKKMKQS